MPSILGTDAAFGGGGCRAGNDLAKDLSMIRVFLVVVFRGHK